ncbi:hypothetical protein [Bradyrhizobium sp. CCBAU 051011]|uniref:hypothetical protein n=1 Tax=Bradyrhizobium sp. CCBAU 051011 TaxID=858422 RepID=UPI00137B314C|nr:hypothetical protein [Bradyrhizobium sp. CCBAU 051011]
MANSVVTPIGGSLVMQTRTGVAAIMNTALAPFILQEQWCGPIWAARDAASFVAVDKDGDLIALGDNIDWIASRARAVEIQQKLPPLADIAAAYKTVDQTLRVKPASGEYQLLASKMLDVLGIKGGDDTDAYVEALAWTLAEVWRANGDPSGTPGWIPIPAFAKAVQHIWRDRDFLGSLWRNKTAADP